ncbi:HET domain protein [Stemphylium lycopersici]|nr:HET domain protein [Stemphylium lycopersici]
MCIPPQENHNPKQKDMRLRGIKLMAQTYKIADKVLVLDSTLKQQSSLIEAAEMKVRIRKGPWATRLWTLQEGRLGRSLYFQVCDTAMSSNYLEDVIGDEKNMKEAMSYLKPLSLEEIAANRCAKLVLRAFATSMELNPLVNTYALLPPQDDPDKEEFRQIAVSIMKQWAEMSELRQAWRPMIEKLDLQSKLRDDDEHLATAIRVSRIDLVDNYGMNMMRRIRGYGFASIEGSRNVLVQGTDQSAGILMDVCAGIRGRTTSRLEDETVCLGILLQIPNLDAVLEIKPLHWGWKQIMAAIGRGRIMSKCHENRMKALLSQIRQNSSTTYQETSVQKYEGANALPQSLIFWNVPRLGYRGWAWAPLSFLAPRPNQDIQAERNGRLTQQGLEVDFPGFIFQGFSHLSSPQACTRDAILVINLNALSPSQSSPFRQTWQRLRLRRDDQTRPHKRASPLISWLYTGELMKMAILIKQERIDDAAILVQIYDTRYGARLTRHVALLERVADNASLEEGVCELHVTAQWVENELWRVG